MGKESVALALISLSRWPHDIGRLWNMFYVSVNLFSRWWTLAEYLSSGKIPKCGCSRQVCSGSFLWGSITSSLLTWGIRNVYFYNTVDFCDDNQNLKSNLFYSKGIIWLCGEINWSLAGNEYKNLNDLIILGWFVIHRSVHGYLIGYSKLACWRVSGVGITSCSGGIGRYLDVLPYGDRGKRREVQLRFSYFDVVTNVSSIESVLSNKLTETTEGDL